MKRALMVLAAAALATGAGFLSPDITVVSPRAGEVLSGGQLVTVAYVVSDQTGIGLYELEFSRDGGATFTPWVTEIAAGLRSVSVTLPNEDIKEAVVRVRARGMIGPIGQGRSGVFSVRKT